MVSDGEHQAGSLGPGFTMLISLVLHSVTFKGYKQDAGDDMMTFVF